MTQVKKEEADYPLDVVLEAPPESSDLAGAVIEIDSDGEQSNPLHWRTALPKGMLKHCARAWMPQCFLSHWWCRVRLCCIFVLMLGLACHTVLEMEGFVTQQESELR